MTLHHNILLNKKRRVIYAPFLLPKLEKNGFAITIDILPIHICLLLKLDSFCPYFALVFPGLYHIKQCPLYLELLKRAVKMAKKALSSAKKTQSKAARSTRTKTKKVSGYIAYSNTPAESSAKPSGKMTDRSEIRRVSALKTFRAAYRNHNKTS
jgi:hypothetical protein